MADEDVVDQFLASPIDAAEALGSGMCGARFQSRCASPSSGRSQPVVSNLRAGWSVEDLRGGGIRLVVEVTEHDNGTLRMAGEQISGGGAHGGGFGAATVERVGGEPSTLRFIVRAYGFCML